MKRPATAARSSTDRRPRSSWRTSSRSQTANCMEVAPLAGDARVAMRDSKDPGGAVLVFDRRQWLAFIAGAKDGRFERP